MPVTLVTHLPRPNFWFVSFHPFMIISWVTYWKKKKKDFLWVNWLLATGKHGNKIKLDSNARLFLYQLVGTWGQLLFPKPWKEFRLWYDIHKAKGIKPFLEGMVIKYKCHSYFVDFYLSWKAFGINSILIKF